MRDYNYNYDMGQSFMGFDVDIHKRETTQMNGDHFIPSQVRMGRTKTSER